MRRTPRRASRMPDESTRTADAATALAHVLYEVILESGVASRAARLGALAEVVALVMAVSIREREVIDPMLDIFAQVAKDRTKFYYDQTFGEPPPREH